MSDVIERAAGFFLAPATAEPRAGRAVVPPAVRAVVLGTPPDTTPLAAALALSMRAATRARTAAVIVWSPAAGDIVGFPAAGDTTVGFPGAGGMIDRSPGAGDTTARSSAAGGMTVRSSSAGGMTVRSSGAGDVTVRSSGAGDMTIRSSGAGDMTVRSSSAGGRALRRGVASRSAADLAARLAARGLPAVPRGRLVWLQLHTDQGHAVAETVRGASALVDAPLVTALTGPRPAVLDELVAEHDIALVAADPDTPLARAALAGLRDRGVAASARAPLRRGPARTLALAGLAAPRLDVNPFAPRQDRS